MAFDTKKYTVRCLYCHASWGVNTKRDAQRAAATHRATSTCDFGLEHGTNLVLFDAADHNLGGVK